MIYSQIIVSYFSLHCKGCPREAINDPLMIGQPTFAENLNRANTRFVGREWLFKNLTNFFEKEKQDSHGILLMAAPGFGKSALIANLVCSKLSSYCLHNQILAYHMCIHSHKNTRDPAKFVQNIAVLISSRIPEYKNLIVSDKKLQNALKDDCQSDPTSGFNNGVLYPLSDLNLRFIKPVYIVIDALDECFESDATQDTTILSIIAQSIKIFPKWLKIIATSRNIPKIRRQLVSLKLIELNPDNPANLQDIERYVDTRIKNLNIHAFPISSLVKKSQGNFLYVKLVLDQFRTGTITTGDISLPESVSSIYYEFFKRNYGTDTSAFRAPRRMFEILAAALSPLKVYDLYKVLCVEDKDFDYEYDFMSMLDDLSIYLRYSPTKYNVVSVFHSSLMEWLTSKANRGGAYYVDEKRGHRLLAEYYLSIIGSDNSSEVTNTPQFIHQLVSHIIKGGSLKRHKERFLELDPKIVKTPDNFTNATLLHFAAGSEHREILDLALNVLDDCLDCADIHQRTPAFYSVFFGRLDNLRLLADREASLDGKSKKFKVRNLRDVEDCKRQMCGYDLLHVASQKGHEDIVEYLLENNANISSLSGTEDSALQLAAEYGHNRTINTLVEYGAELDKSCLYYAASQGRLEVVLFLLDKGIEDTCLDCSLYPSNDFLSEKVLFRSYIRLCNTALHAAAINDFPQVIEALLAKKNNAINCTNYYGKGPLHEAVYHNNYHSVQAFLEKGANPSQICKFTPAHGDSSRFIEFCPCRYTPLHIAAYRGFSAITYLLLQFNASQNATNCDGLHPIHVASCRGYDGVVTALVKHGVDINSNSTTGMTPLHYACKCRASKIFSRLFALGANAFSRSEDGKTSIDFIFEAAKFNGTLSISIDHYVDQPIDPIDFKSGIRFSLFDKEEDALFPSLIKFFRCLSNSSLDMPTHEIDYFLGLVNENVVQNNSTADWVRKLVGSAYGADFKNFKRIRPIVPPFQTMLDMVIVQAMTIDERNVFTSFISTALISVTMATHNCSRLMYWIEKLWIYSVDAYLDWGANVNCEENGLSPILVYLRHGGRHMDKVLVKHKVTIDIKCGENFEDSAFHLAAYHKLHYLQYLSVFDNRNEWEKYLKSKDAIFDYLFDEYKKSTQGGQVRVSRVGDGPVIKAIKSHLRGFKIVDECLDDEGYTALQRAAQGSNAVAAKHFLNWGANASLESPEGFDLLNLTIWYAIKYRPRLNFHQPSLLTALETELASMTASVITDHITRDKPLDIGCNQTVAMTILHLAATRGMWRFIDDLFKAKQQSRVIGLDANCTTKHGVTPLYLAKIYGGGECDWENPWCKVGFVLSEYGGTEIIPEPIAEYFIIVNSLFHGTPEKFNHNFSLESLRTLEDSCGQDECSLAHHDSHLIHEIHYGLTGSGMESCNCKNTNWLHDIANALASKESKLRFSRTNLLHFTTASINAIREIIKTLLSANEGTGCRPRKTKRKQTNATTISNIDMCSGETVLQLNDIVKLSKKKYKIYIADYEAVEDEVAFVREAIDNENHESQRYKDLNRESYIFSRNHLCQRQALTFKYVQLRLLMHVLFSWNRHVMRHGRYPNIPRFALYRIKRILFTKSRKKLVQFVIALSNDDVLKQYEYLQWIRFKKPPLFESLFNQKT